MCTLNVITAPDTDHIMSRSVWRVFGVAKPAARDFVDHVRTRLNEVAPVPTRG